MVRPGRLRRRRTTYVHERVQEYRGYWSAAASRLGADLIDVSDQIWEVRRGSVATRVFNDLVALDDPVVLALAGDKALCYRLAAERGIPIPRYRLLPAADLRGAWDWISSLGRPVVVKPRRNTSSGIGVTVGVRSRRDLVRAAARARLRGREMLVEARVGGETSRLLFVGGEMVHAVRRRGVAVVGDGRRTIRQLLAADGLAAIADDRVTRLTLAAQGYSDDHIPEAGRRVVARALPAREQTTSELRTVYDEEITNQVSASLAREVGALVDAIGSEFAGVDVVTDDPGRTLAESGGALLEVNTTPGIHHHCALSRESTCHVAELVLERALRRAEARPAASLPRAASDDA